MRVAMIIRSCRVIEEMVGFLVAWRVYLMWQVDLTGGVDWRSWKRYVVLLRQRGFQLFKSIPKIGQVERVQTEPVGHAVPTSNTWRLALGLLGMLPLWVPR
jgi:hypothetical protein